MKMKHVWKLNRNSIRIQPENYGLVEAHAFLLRPSDQVSFSWCYWCYCRPIMLSDSIVIYNFSRQYDPVKKTMYGEGGKRKGDDWNLPENRCIYGMQSSK